MWDRHHLMTVFFWLEKLKTKKKTEKIEFLWPSLTLATKILAKPSSFYYNLKEKWGKHIFQQSKVCKKVSKQKTIITIFLAECNDFEHFNY